MRPSASTVKHLEKQTPPSNLQPAKESPRQPNTMEGCGAHKIKKKTRNLLGGGTFDHEFFGPEVSFARNRFCCSRKAKSCFSPKTGSWWQHPRKTWYHPKSVHIDVSLCVDSEYVIKNTISARNLKIIVKNRFSFLLLREVFFYFSENSIWSNRLQKWILHIK